VAELRRMRATQAECLRDCRRLALLAQTETKRARIEFETRTVLQHLRDIDAVLDARAGR
jgi:hypothetical protein